MRSMRRHFTKGNSYFLTHVTYQRKPILVENVDLLWNAIDRYRKQSSFDLTAWVILPDHWHCIIDPLENDLSSLMKKIKLSFAQKLLRRHNSASGRTWQNRYWDHVIRDGEDLNRHVDYIHYNPVKHGLVRSSVEYPHSSFAEYMSEDYYVAEWGVVDSVKIEGEFGE